MVNNLNQDVLLSVVAEWLQEWQVPPYVSREKGRSDLTKLKRILAIAGPRRAGKTYFMYQLIDELLRSGRYSKADILFVDFEDYRLVGFNAGDIDRLFAAFYQLAGRYPTFLFLDEVQNLEGWSRIVRTLHNRARFKIVISGSNLSLLEPEIATELRGRYENLIMMPFSFKEYLSFRGVQITKTTFHTPARGAVVSCFDEYMKRGGFPEVIMAEDDVERRRLLQSYYKTIFYRDVLERYGIKARYVLELLMSNFLEAYASIFSITKFEKQLRQADLKSSKRTIANHLHYLQDAFFIIANEKFSYSVRKRSMNPKKVYLADTGFASLGRQSVEGLGRILENIVAVELFRKGKDMYYYRDRRECDFIIQEGTRPAFAIQVCWELTEQNRKRELVGLLQACMELGIPEGLILTYNQEFEQKEQGVEIKATPVWKWLIQNS